MGEKTEQVGVVRGKPVIGIPGYPVSAWVVCEQFLRPLISTMLGVPPPPLQTLEQANLSPMALGFYAENRRVANGKARRVLGWSPRYPTYREGLAAIMARE